MEGQILGNRYQLIERIGGGGMAVVYKAKCLLLNRYVAVKVLRSEFTDDEEFVKRFRVEAQAAASLSHPNIVSIYDVGHEGKTHYIVMEYVDGITLKEYITQRGVLPWRDAINIAIQICSALEQAHKNGIVHRDIKPHNILITKEGIAKVTDFGIARAASSATITMVGSTIGSVHYFSPEQARGGYIDEKSDLYSLGITIYEMVTGKVPFDGETPVAVALKHIQEKPVKPIEINPDIPKSVNDIIVKAIKKDLNLRYRSASEMLSDLQMVLGEPNTRIADNDAIEDMPTRKMQAVGRNVDLMDESDDDFDDNYEYENIDEEGKKIGKTKNAQQKKDRLSVWLGVAAGIIIAGIILLIGLKLLLPAVIPEDTADFVVEDYTGKDFEEVQSELEKYGITAVEDKRTYSDKYDKGIIISQTVKEGNTLKSGGSIGFEVSDGPKTVKVPEVAGKELRVAEQLLKNEDLDYSDINEYSETVATGLVIRTDPAEGTEVEPGTTITVYVSLGPELETVKVPNLLGKTRKEAEKLLADRKLKIGAILPEGIISDVAKIVKQYPLPDADANEGDAVELTFEIDENTNGQTNNGDTQEQQEQQGQGQSQDKKPEESSNGQSEVQSTRKELITISLNSQQDYGDQVSVYIETTPADTNVSKVEFDRKVDKDQFPFSTYITLSNTAKTHFVVMLDGVIVQEGDK